MNNSEYRRALDAMSQEAAEQQVAKKIWKLAEGLLTELELSAIMDHVYGNERAPVNESMAKAKRRAIAKLRAAADDDSEIQQLLGGLRWK